MSDLLVIVPTRGRPQSVARIVQAWTETDAWQHAELTFVADEDDPTVEAYKEAFATVALPDPATRGPARLVTADVWRPLVPKLNLAAVTWAEEHFALGFAGDDHLPRTAGWAKRYLDELCEMGTGIVYGNDLYQGDRLPTQWAMTSDIVRALGRMVPADVEHMYCDNSILALGGAAGCIRYLPDVVVEHMHPIAGKAQMDDGYQRVNSARQYASDRVAFLRYGVEQLRADVEAVKTLRTGYLPDGRSTVPGGHMPKHNQPDPEQKLRDERAQAEQAGDTARVAEIDRQLGEMTGEGGQTNL
ncbi:MAG TPA: hypothetical protein VFR23_15740 [Jiangellaceae bacterium]|nr:hypothetical protein [Jiangellaceae bacterium]